MSQLQLFLNKNGDINSFVDENNNATIIESYAMFYCSIDDITVKNLIIKRTLQLCKLSKKIHDYPCPYKLYRDKIYKRRNTQHFLWCAKMFHKHFLLTNNEIYYKKAQEIVDYVCNNMYNTQNQTFINWFGEGCDLNKVSPKSLTCAEILLIFNKQTYLDSTIEFMYKNLFNTETKLFDSTFDIKTKERKKEIVSYLHENLEFIEGLFNCWEYNKEKKYKMLAENLLKQVAPLISNNPNNLAILQYYYWSSKYLSHDFLNCNVKNIYSSHIKKRVESIKENVEQKNFISPYTYSNHNSVFGHIYLKRLEKNNFI